MLTSSIELTPEAKAIAELDAICDEFERAFRSGDVVGDVDALGNLEPWVERVAPQWQAWLREELTALRADLLSLPANPTDESAAEYPADVNAQSWRAISRCEAFADLPHEIKVALARRATPALFDAGSILLRSGEPASGLYLITAGRVQIAQGNDKLRREIDTDQAGGLLGEMSILTGYPCSADVRATTPVEAIVLSPAALDEVRELSPELDFALSRLVSQRLGHHRHDALCGKTLGGYRLRRCIGRGAMGVVYEADNESGEACALKMLPHRFLFNADVVSRFDQETALLQQLEHPNVVAFRDHFIAYRTRFIVLDLYDGADLQTVIRHRGGISEATARGVLGQIASGLLHAHAQGILHLDLKPANILVNKAGRIAITDFGVSRLIESETEDQRLVGTPLYMPPEQFLMQDIGPPCDWYAFGCIMYELLTGQRLFPEDNQAELLDAKFRVPISGWPQVDGASDEFHEQLRNSLQPMGLHRSLALESIATWARPVPELALDPAGLPSTVES